jgi:hypothetical protein
LYLEELVEIPPRGVERGREYEGPTGFPVVHKECRGLDRLGRGVSEDFWNIPWSEVLAYLKFDLFRNDMFTMGMISQSINVLRISHLLAFRVVQLLLHHHAIGLRI